MCTFIRGEQRLAPSCKLGMDYCEKSMDVALGSLCWPIVPAQGRVSLSFGWLVYYRGVEGDYWSSTEINVFSGGTVYISMGNGISPSAKTHGYTVRCIRN